MIKSQVSDTIPPTTGTTRGGLITKAAKAATYLYGEEKHKKRGYPAFNPDQCKGFDIIDPRTTGPAELKDHLKTIQELNDSTINKTLETLNFHARHPIIPLDLKNPSFENFHDHIKCCRTLGVPDRWTGELHPITKIAEENLRKAWNRALTAWGVLEAWPRYRVKKVPQRVKALIVYTPEQAYQLHHHKYVNNRQKNRLIQYLFFFGNITGLAPEKEWVILNLDDLRFQPDGTALLVCRRPKVNNSIRTLRVEKTPSTSPVHKNLLDLIQNRDRFAERTETALLVNPTTGRRWTETCLRTYLTKYGKMVVPDFYPYLMRHFDLTARMIEWGKDESSLSRVALWAGHGSNIKMTQAYLDLARMFDDAHGSWLCRALNLQRELVQESARAMSRVVAQRYKAIKILEHEIRRDA